MQRRNAIGTSSAFAAKLDGGGPATSFVRSPATPVAIGGYLLDPLPHYALAALAVTLVVRLFLGRVDVRKPELWHVFAYLALFCWVLFFLDAVFD